MRRRVTRAIREKPFSERSALFGRETSPVKSSDELDGIDSQLHRLLPQGARLRGTLKGKDYRARVQRNGKVRFQAKLYKSLTVAAKAAVKRPINGWWFWQIERGRGNWVRLNKVRTAGTPIYVT
jgi:hypothetical protein